MTESSNNIECIKLDVVEDDQQDYELMLRDMRTLPELAEELDSLLRDPRCKRVVRIALLPPVPGGLSIPLAFKVVVDTWQAVDCAPRPSLECFVQSEQVRHALTPMLSGKRSEATFKFGSVVLSVISGDIIATAADAIVNASNTSLRLGGGVSAAIRHACGPGLAAEMASIARRRPLEDGHVAVTHSHGLRTARYIIHAATAAGDDLTISQSLRNIFQCCAQRSFGSIALPAIGTGTGGMSMEHFSELLVAELGRHSSTNPSHPQQVRLVLFNNRDFDSVMALLETLIGNRKIRN